MLLCIRISDGGYLTMNKRMTALLIAAAAMSVFCLAACGGDKKPAATTAASTAATTAAATTAAPDAGSANAGGIPKEGDTYKGKKVGSVEQVPDCDDDSHGVYYIYDENEELIEAIKY